MVEIAPSLISADFTQLGAEVRRLEEAGIHRLHLDVMDGHFVPNITLGAGIIQALRPLTDMFFETHLMMLQPEEHIEVFVQSGSNAITVHAETGLHLMRSLQIINSLGVEAGVALNPATSPQVLEYVWEEIAYVTVMTVNPGFAGQKFLEPVLPKVEHIRALTETKGRAVALEVDGGVTVENAARIAAAGADRVVSGSSVFAAPDSLPQTLTALGQELEKGEKDRA